MGLQTDSIAAFQLRRQQRNPVYTDVEEPTAAYLSLDTQRAWRPAAKICAKAADQDKIYSGCAEATCWGTDKGTRWSAFDGK